MRIAKWIMIVLLTLAAVLVGGGYLLSPKFTVSRSIGIAAPPEKVYALVADPRGWKQWSVWNRRDPAMQIDYFGPASGAGAVGQAGKAAWRRPDAERIAISGQVLYELATGPDASPRPAAACGVCCRKAPCRRAP
ncbi:MAG: SRPBCC family protein [Betaproteobacteria bacterium]|nr:SRPBCC family protein [Betaproteobacteria bacterium]